jgi:dTMP kinase
MATFALIALVWDRTRSAGAVAGLLALRIIPSVFSGAVASVVSDRLDRKRAMIFCDLSRGFLILLAAVTESIAYLYFIIFTMELFNVIFVASRDAGLPNLIPEDNRLTMANSMTMGSTYGTIPLAAAFFALLVVGTSPFLGTLEGTDFLALHPYALAFSADALTFFFSAFMVWRIRNPMRETQRRPAEEREHLTVRDIRGSLTFAWRDPFMRSFTAAIATGTLGGGSLFTVGVIYVREVLGGTDTQFGFLMALFGAGMLLGIVGLQFLGRVRAKQVIFRLALVVSGGTLIWMSLITVMFMAYIAALVFGAFFSMLFMTGITMVQEQVPDENRGKAFAAFHSVSRVCLVLGAGMSAGLASSIDRFVINLGVYHLSVWGTTIAMFIGGVLIVSVIFLPLGRKTHPVNSGVRHES